MAEFYSARGWEIPPLPWTNLSPPFSAESANRAKSEFLSSMSHELRNPLNAILGFSQLLARDSANPLTEAQKVAVEQILMGGDHLLKLTADVLDLARIESGTLMAVIEGVDVREIVEEALNLASGLAASSGISLHNGCQGKSVRMPLVRADRMRLRQVVLNLVINGIKYNAEGGFVSVTGEPRGEAMFRLSVTDTGYGIAEDLASRLFVPFDRLGAEYSATEGTGIGLTISKQLMDLMNGEIGFESEAGKGSTFWLEIPLAPQDTAQSTKEMPRRPAVPAKDESAAVKQFRVLYIEDSASNVALMHGIVETVPDAMMVSAHTAKLGLELATAMPPDLILMDLNLLEFDGFEALTRLRSKSRFGDIPVIAITADATAKTEERCRLAGFERFLTKPIDIEEVVQIITRRIHYLSDTRDLAEDK